MQRRNERQVVLMALLVLGMAGMAARAVPGAAALDEGLRRLVTPLQAPLTGASARVRDLLGGTRSLEALNQRVTELEQENARLQSENLRLLRLKQELRDLREAVRFQGERPDLDLMGASIVAHALAREPGHLARTITLDVGRSQGVMRRMTVASPRGLVGQVLRVSEGSCDVLLISDPSSSVGARIERTREAGMVFGTPTGELIMRYLPQNQPGEPAKVLEGDLVYTSGLSRRFPPEILIGQVVEVRQHDFDAHQEALIRPAVDFNALEQALVVTAWEPPAE